MQRAAVPQAVAVLRGGNGYPGVSGTAWFQQQEKGVLVTVRVQGLPAGDAPCGGRWFAMHVHSGSTCTGSGADAFADTNGHYDPNGCPHPDHAGDLPPLLGCHGVAYCSVLTDRFTLDQVVGRTLIVHADLDDFTTQPSGNAGVKIACGAIRYR